MAGKEKQMQLKSYDEMTPDQKMAYDMGRLDGPTDEDVEVLAKASRHTFQDRNGEWQNVVTQADLDEARRLLGAVFQARKERA